MPETLLVSDIIRRVDRQYPNPYANSDKIEWINDFMDEFFGDLGKIDIVEVPTVADVFMYALPDGVMLEDIKGMTVSTGDEASDPAPTQVSYRPAKPDEDLAYYTYFIVVEGYFGIYPTPEETDQIIRITYQSRATQITQTTDTIELRSDYKNMIVYYVAIKIAEALDDIAKANNFTNQYNFEARRMKEAEYKKMGKYPVTRRVNKHSMKTKRMSGLVARRLRGKWSVPGNGRLW